jgi:phosphoribosylformylglycinamidine synthase subunit PurL
MKDACLALDTPVTGGNVSFHNESRDNAIFPTPTIGMLGVIDNLEQVMSAEFKNEGDIIYMLGADGREVGGSEYLKQYSGIITGEGPQLDLEKEVKLQKTLLHLIKSKLIVSAHDISEGGLAIALAEKSILSGTLACDIFFEEDITVGLLFGESQSRVVVSVSPEKEAEFLSELNGLEHKELGVVIKGNFLIRDFIDTSIEHLTNIYENAIPYIMEK